MSDQLNAFSRAPAVRPVLHVIDALDCGGAQELLVLLARLTPRETHPTCVAVIQPATGMLDRLKATGARVYCLGRPRPSIFKPLAFLRYVIGVIGDIRRICRLENIAILHCHLSDAEFLGILAGRLHGVERILDTVHTPSLLPSRESHDPRTSLRKLFMPWVLNQADWVVAVSAETGRMLEKMGVQAKRIRVVENGIDVSAYDLPPQPALRQSLGIGPDEPVLVTTARLTEQKGHAYLIEAMPAVLERFPLARLLLLGQGELRGQLEERVRSLGLTGRVDFLGVRSDVPALLALADVFVLPSLWEGTSLALLEAMAAARPIAATDIPGNRPLLEDQRDCLLAAPGRPEALAQAVIRLLQDRELAAKLGTQARAEAWQRFDIRTMLAAYERLWATSPRDQETS